jgi:hypothetical protein
MKNKLHYSFLLGLSLITILLLLSFLPSFSIGSFSFREVDLLADIRTDEPISNDSLVARQPDSIVTKSATEKKISAISNPIACPGGITCIEDFSKDNSALTIFFKALTNVQRGENNVRIAFYGDSFIEGDVFCGSFRDSLQSIFGGRGVGLVPITSAVSGFRNTIKHSFSNWRTISIMQKDPVGSIGISGYTFVPLEGNGVEFKPSKQRFLREFSQVKLYYKAKNDAILNYIVDTLESSEAIEVSEKIQEWKFNGKGIHRVQFEFFPYEGVEVYGASFENGPGVYVDNFSVRGNSGMNLPQISKNMFQEMNTFRNYKLVILQFGLNMIVEDKADFSAYTQRMVGVVKYLKACLPQTSFLLLSVSDRSNNTTGKFRTMRSIPALRDAQREIARQTGIAFWDMYQAMGGENSMVKYTESKPPLGARDYTHLTFRGGNKLGGLLVKTILAEKKKYDTLLIKRNGI